MSDDVNYKDLMIAKAITKEELDQEAVWAEQFEHWWDAEGQYHRAGGNDYCKTFAWWAWLNREKSKQAEIDGLKTKLSLQRDRNKALETELTSSRNYGDKLNERIRKVSWLLGNNSFERTIKNCLKILRGEHEQ